MRTTTIIVLLTIFSLTSCKNTDKQVDVTTPETSKPVVVDEKPPFEPFKVLAVSHMVKDYAAWRKVFDGHESERAANGLSIITVARDVTNNNKIYVFLKAADIQKAKDFAANPALKEVMKKGGVTGEPIITFADVLRFDDATSSLKDRVRISHKVKDYDAWLKAYDAGKEMRMNNGLVDRALSRSMDDANMVSVSFSISDMAKAKALISGSELKKIMTEAGVVGDPVIDYFTAQ